MGLMSQSERHAVLIICYIVTQMFKDHAMYMQTIFTLFLDTFKSEKEHCLKQHCAKWINSLRLPMIYNFTEAYIWLPEKKVCYVAQLNP